MVARKLGVCCWTVMDVVALRGTLLVEDPVRFEKVRALAIDETQFLSAQVDRQAIQSPAPSISAAR